MIVERGSRGNRFCLKIIDAGFRSFFSACLANLIIIDRKTYLIYKSKLAKGCIFLYLSYIFCCSLSYTEIFLPVITAQRIY